jgi:hypothetical protein
MPFVVKMTTPQGSVCWLSAVKVLDARTFGSRENAWLFQTRAAAHSAIGSLPQSMAGTGAVFSIHSAQ